MSPLRARVAAALSLLVVAALFVTAPSSAAEEPAPTATPEPTVEPSVAVTWPEVTAVDPERTDLVVDVRASGYTRLHLDTWPTEHDWTDPVDGDGPHVVQDPPDGRHHLRLWGCTTESDCRVLSLSPELLVARSLPVRLGWDAHHVDQRPGGTTVLDGYVAPWSSQDGGDLRWELVSRDGSGASWTGVEHYDHVAGDWQWSRWEAPLVLPEDVPEGSYDLLLHLADHVEPIGLLTGGLSAVVEVDATAPVIESATGGRVVYPARDEYRDWVRFTVQATGASAAEAVVRDASGAEVVRIPLVETAKGWAGAFHGRDDRSRVVPEGEYAVELVASDLAGNTASTTRWIEVSHAEREMTTETLTLRPADVLLDSRVGACSQLRRPSARGGRGTLGFYSQTRCTHPRRSDVSAVFGVYLPPAFLANYKEIRLKMLAGGAVGSRGAYLVETIESPKGQFTERLELGPSMRTWKMRFQWSDIHDVEGERPYLIWHLGLTAGSRYDVQQMQLVVRYETLR